MDRESLAALAQRAQGGDAAARTALLVELYTVVRKQCYFLLDNRASAEDAVQDTMIAIHRGLARFRGDADPRTWAITIAIRTAVRVRRRERRMVPNAEVAAAAIFDVDQQAAAELVLLRKALQRLPAKKRDAFVLMGLFELSAKDAGKALGTFANTAASRYRHARAELETWLRERPAESFDDLSGRKVDEISLDGATNTEEQS